MDIRAEYIALNAHFSVGRRSVAALASESTLPPAAAVEEIVHRGREAHERTRHDARRAAQPNAAEAVEAEAELERLPRERDALARVRADEWGPFHGDRLWLGTLAGFVVLVLLIGLAVLTVSAHLVATGPSLAVGVVLCGTIAFLAGNWSGRAHTWGAAVAYFTPAGLALLAAWALAHSQGDGLTLGAVSLALLGAAAAGGVLTGRSRRVVPALEEAAREHRMTRQIAAAEKRLKVAQADAAQHDPDFALESAQIATRTMRAVEEYLGKVDDGRLTSGARATTTADLRARAGKLIAAWPTSLAN